MQNSKCRKPGHSLSAFCILNSELPASVCHCFSENRAASKAHTLGRVASGGDLDRAVLELWNLAERIEHRVGQHVRSRLVKAERDEHSAARHAIVGARVERDFTAA